MARTLSRVNSSVGKPSLSALPYDSAGVSQLERLTQKHETEALTFLSTDQVSAVIMSSLIKDNAVESQFNRGSFYGCRDRKGQLQGVGLIGHITLFEARRHSAIAALALATRREPSVYAIAGEQKQVERFWECYTGGNEATHRRSRELLLEQRMPIAIPAGTNGSNCDLRPATTDNLLPVMLSHAQMTREELGTDPLQTDPDGFRRRCLRRIQQQRVWALIEDDRLIFKADIICQTPRVIYLEGIYVAPQERGKGIGTSCLAQLGQKLLSRMEPGGVIFVLVNEQHFRAQAFYRKVGYKYKGCYERITLQP